MKTAGLDIATCTGMALVGEGEDRGKTVYLPKQRGFERLQLIANAVQQTLVVWQPELMVVEDYAFCKNVEAFIKLVECGTVIRSVLYELKIPWVDVKPTSLKKWTIEKRKPNKELGETWASKSLMARAANERWGYSSHSADIVDAFCLAQMGQLGMESLKKIEGVRVGMCNSLSPSVI